MAFSPGLKGEDFYRFVKFVDRFACSDKTDPGIFANFWLVQGKSKFPRQILNIIFLSNSNHYLYTPLSKNISHFSVMSTFRCRSCPNCHLACLSLNHKLVISDLITNLYRRHTWVVFTVLVSNKAWSIPAYVDFCSVHLPVWFICFSRIFLHIRMRRKAS